MMCRSFKRYLGGPAMMGPTAGQSGTDHCTLDANIEVVMHLGQHGVMSEPADLRNQDTSAR